MVMNKKILSLFAAVSTAVAAVAGNVPPFKAALDKVDQGGEFLSVSTIRHLEQIIAPAETPVTVQNIGEAVIPRLQKALGTSLVKAQAVSSIEAAPGCWVFKHYQYIGKKDMSLPSIFKVLNTPDAELDFTALPADTVFAASGNLDTAEIYQLLEAEFTSKEDLFKAFFLQIPAFAGQRGIALKPLLKSISGKWKIVIAGTNTTDLLVNIDIPDNDGVLAAILRKELKLQPDAKAGIIPIVMLPVKVAFGDQKVSIGISANRKNKAVVAQNPDFANYITRIGSTGTGYALLNITPELIASVKAFQSPQLACALELAPFSMLGLMKNDDTGVYCISAANVSGTKMTFTAGTAVLGSIVLPALQQARDRARTVVCVSNLKMIGIGLMMYSADDKNGRIPDKNGIAGLQMLIDKEYLTDMNAFKCQAKPIEYQNKKLTSDCPYIYIGGAFSDVAERSNPSTLPVAFEKPNHKQQCPVLFADGHVEVLSIKPAYTNPNQVIGVLTKRIKTNPERLDKMLRAIMEN